jgi:hypothetical protein
MSIHSDHHPEKIEDTSLMPAIWTAVVLFALAAFLTWLNMA